MPLKPIREMLTDAQTRNYAVGYFESWNLESLQGVIDAAEKAMSPVIIGFNGEFLCHNERRVEERLSIYGRLGREAAETAKIPCGFICNECPDDRWIRKAVETGFNLVMPADPGAPYEEFCGRVRDIVQHAHANGVAVESEVGELPSGLDAGQHREGRITDPALAEDFVRVTGVDLLSVSVGNVHIRLSGSSALDLRRLSQIHERVHVPLVLHGGSGIDDKSLSAAIGLGVVKVNYGTYLKQRYLAALRKALAFDCENPHELVGLGGQNDIMVAGRNAVRDAVMERLPSLNCVGKA